MKPTLFIVGGSSTALEIRETVDQFFKDKYFAVYNVISDEETPILLFSFLSLSIREVI
jgi:hypothetical protein